MKRARSIGVDPGPVPGIVELRYLDRRIVDVHVVQCTANAAVPLLTAMLAELSASAWDTFVQIERFVVGRRSTRSATAAAGAITRDLVTRLEHEAEQLGASTVLASAAAVKPWATDARLEAAGLIAATKGMRHARDAARHALFAAVRDAGQPDPMSKEFVS